MSNSLFMVYTFLFLSVILLTFCLVFGVLTKSRGTIVISSVGIGLQSLVILMFRFLLFAGMQIGNLYIG